MTPSYRRCFVCGRVDIRIGKRWFTHKYSDGTSFIVHRHRWED